MERLRHKLIIEVILHYHRTVIIISALSSFFFFYRLIYHIYMRKPKVIVFQLLRCHHVAIYIF